MIKRHIAVIAFDGISPFHLSIPSIVFGEDRVEEGIPPYEVTVCSLENRPIKTNAGFSIVTESGLSGLMSADMVIVPSWRITYSDSPLENLIKALKEAHQRGTVIVGLCLGTFVLAATGLLNGRRATTHWRYVAELSRRFPDVQVDANVLWVDHGDVVTSAGTTAGIDCCLHLMRKDCGTQVVNRVARRLVTAPHRSGDQAQFIERPLRAGGVLHQSEI